MRKDEVRLHSDHLRGNPRRVLGVNAGRLIHCEKHGQFYPASESCPWCLSWAEEMDERARKATLKAVEPVKVERTLGRRYFEAYVSPIDKHLTDHKWAHENQDYWENAAEATIADRGQAVFDAAYP